MPCFGVVAQLVRASACHAEGRGFEPLQSRQLNKKQHKNPQDAIIASWFLFPLDNVQFASYNLPAIFTSFGPIV